MAEIFFGVGLGIWFLSYLDFSFLLISSERIGTKIRLKYLESLLKQESAWYDTINPSELSARLGKETLAITRALGEKVSTIVLAFSMCVSGLAFAFTKGWSFSLVMLAAFPFLTFTTKHTVRVLDMLIKL